MTERLVWRRFTAADADDLLTLDGDARVMRFLDRRVKSRADIQAQVLPRLLAFYDRYPGFGCWAAHAHADGGFVGWFSLHPTSPSAAAMVRWADAPPGEIAVASMGYRLRVSAWGRGYATEGARALVRRAFTHLGIQEVVATTMAVNTGSRRVLEKAGLTYDRTVHVDWPDPLPGTEHGEVEYRLSLTDWMSGQAAGERDAPYRKRVQNLRLSLRFSKLRSASVHAAVVTRYRPAASGANAAITTLTNGVTQVSTRAAGAG